MLYVHVGGVGEQEKSVGYRLELYLMRMYVCGYGAEKSVYIYVGTLKRSEDIFIYLFTTDVSNINIYQRGNKNIKYYVCVLRT